MNLRSRIDFPFPLAVALVWLPLFAILFIDPDTIPVNGPWYRFGPAVVWCLSALFYAPTYILDSALGFDGNHTTVMVACVAQSALLTWALFAWRARRAARLRSEGEAGKVDP